MNDDIIQSHPNFEKFASEEHKLRLEKVEKLRERGIEPWPLGRTMNTTIKELVDNFKEGDEKEYKVAGRLVNLRFHGKTAFGDIQTARARVQIYLRKDVIGDEAFDVLQHLIDIGDTIWVRGTTFTTKTGEITIKVQEFFLGSKCLFPLPEKFHGLVDVETRYRQRYLDLISNAKSRDTFLKRSEVIKDLRRYLDKHDFIEVETPMLHPIAGGAAARPFTTHHNALDDDFYLRIAPELYLKRLVVGGLERVYEINRNFRNEGVSTRHNPEFTMLEFYWGHEYYEFAMDFVEKMLQDVINKVHGTLQIPFGDHTIDYAKFRRLSVSDAVKEFAKFSDKDLASHETLDVLLQKHGITLKNTKASLGEKVFALFEELVEHQLIQPTYIIDYPIEVSPLAKRDADNPTVASRFELFIGGMEIANGFNELNNPFEQAQRFREQLDAHRAGDDEAHQYDADYVLALEHGLPPTVGVGVGIDRLVMLLTNTTSIRDVILFPTLKKRQ